MKKSQLRNIIRESIKQLMTEQSGGYTKYNVRSCTGGSTYGSICLPNSANAQIGDVVTYPTAPPNGNPRDYFIRQVLGSCPEHHYNYQSQPFITSPTNCPNCCSTSQWQSYSANFGGACTTNQTGGACTGNTIFGCMDSTASNYDPTATVDDGSCTYGNNSHETYIIQICDQGATNYPNGYNLHFDAIMNNSSGDGLQCNGQMCTVADLQPGQNEFEVGSYSQTTNNIFDLLSGTTFKLLSFGDPIFNNDLVDFTTKACPPPLPSSAPLPDPCKQFIISYPTLLDQKTFCKDECGGTTINLDPMCDCCRELRER